MKWVLYTYGVVFMYIGHELNPHPRNVHQLDPMAPTRKKKQDKNKNKNKRKNNKTKDISGSKSLLGKEAKMIGVLQSLFQ
jgi:hypothetical protein